MNIMSRITVEHEGRLVEASTSLEGSVLVVRTEDGRSSYEPVRAIPPELQLRLMLSSLLGTDISDPQYEPNPV